MLLKKLFCCGVHPYAQCANCGLCYYSLICLLPIPYAQCANCVLCYYSLICLLPIAKRLPSFKAF